MWVLGIGLVGYLTCVLGFAAALVLTLSADRLGRKFQELVSGFSSGALIAFVCFGLLPEAFAESRLFTGIAGILAGAVAAAFLDIKFQNNKTGIAAAFGIILHNIPEGIALGQVLAVNSLIGLSMCAIITLHCLPEAMTFLIPLKASGKPIKKLLIYCMLLALPMCFGSMFGATLGGLSDMFLSLCLSFAGGVIIYISCGNIFPDQREISDGLITKVGAALGFSTGIVITVL